MKQCITCTDEKPLSEFYTSKDTIGGYRNQCKKCMNKNTVEARQNKCRNGTDYLIGLFIGNGNINWKLWLK